MNETIQLKKEVYHAWIITILSYEEDGLTAYELAEVLEEVGHINLATRQATAPRLTELVHKGLVKVVGKKFDVNTRRKVSIYGLA